MLFKSEVSQSLDDEVREPTDYPIGNLFPTLSEVLSELPQSLGVNIEIKSPQQSKTGIWENDFGQNYDRNTLVDLTLDAILNEQQKRRRIILSSFDLWICSIVRKKQDRYPVFLLIDPNSKVNYFSDIRMSSVNCAILFAKAQKLDGIVCCIDPILHKIDHVAKLTRDFNLSLFTYGEQNNFLENIVKQNLANVDGIITDRLKQLLPEVIRQSKKISY